MAIKVTYAQRSHTVAMLSHAIMNAWQLRRVKRFTLVGSLKLLSLMLNVFLLWFAIVLLEVFLITFKCFYKLQIAFYNNSTIYNITI